MKDSRAGGNPEAFDAPPALIERLPRLASSLRLEVLTIAQLFEEVMGSIVADFKYFTALGVIDRPMFPRIGKDSGIFGRWDRPGICRSPRERQW
jgi:hypothetical protein